MHWTDRLIGWFSPIRGVKRASARRILNSFEAATPGNTRKIVRANTSINDDIDAAGESLREQARHYDQNHDLAGGILDTLVTNCVGRHGVTVDPAPMSTQGEIHEELADELLDIYERWSKRPEVTWHHSRASMERLAFRTWCRDGEMLAKLLPGQMTTLQHGTDVPLSLELLEADFLPIEYEDERNRIRQGIELNAWRRPVAYWLYKDDPNETTVLMNRRDLKRWRAGRIIHPKMIFRLHQLRGTSIFARVMRRLEDLKDYEESERVAARVAAAMAAYIKKGVPDHYNGADKDADREFEIAPGQVWDNLMPGEEVATIESKRPSSLLVPFRDGMLRAVAAGTRTSFSSIARNYDGSYSSQRQELVEARTSYDVLFDEFANQFSVPVYQAVVQAAIAAGVVKLPPDLDRKTLFDAEFYGPVTPWIDPLKEAEGFREAGRMGAVSQSRVIRAFGGRPREVLARIQRERKWADGNNLIFTTDPRHNVKNQVQDDEGETNDQ